MKYTKDKFQLVEYKREEVEKLGYTNYSYWKSTFRTFLKNKTSGFLLIFMFLMILMSFIYPLVSDVDPHKIDLLNVSVQKPSGTHWFGTDLLGRDMWARTWYGTRTSLLLGFTVALFDIGIGVVVGSGKQFLEYWK